MKAWLQTYSAMLAAVLTTWFLIVILQPYLVLFVLKMWAR